MPSPKNAPLGGMSKPSSIPPQRDRTFGTNLTNMHRSPTPIPLDSEEGVPLPCLICAEFGDPCVGVQLLPPLKQHKTELQGSRDKGADARMKIPLSHENGAGSIGTSVIQHSEECPVTDRRVSPSLSPLSRIDLSQVDFRRPIPPLEVPPQLGKSGADTVAPEYFMGPVAASASRRGHTALGNVQQTRDSGWRATAGCFGWSSEPTRLCQSTEVVHRLWQSANTEEDKDDSDEDELEDVHPILELSQQPPTSYGVLTNFTPNRKRSGENGVQHDWLPFLCEEALQLFSDAFDDVYNL